MRSFYHYAMRYRGVESKNDDRKILAEWIFQDHSFPKQAKDYQTISSYLEMHSPFANALNTFDEIWEAYQSDW
ncbi:YozE family protein [Halalkalibacillus halophilus]|uniref:YozE family protein n=1 Tax=Halalkalibacillus halophilus TaxID=392827 RepID=UPI0004012BEF|nr:YozE family protein [Halalkalibacillus halophilus]